MEPKLNTNTDITTILREIETILSALLMSYTEVNEVPEGAFPSEYWYLINQAIGGLIIMPDEGGDDGGDVPPSGDETPAE